MERNANRSHSSSFAVVTFVLALVVARPALGQFQQNRALVKKDRSAYPPDAKEGYGVFIKKCSTCHQTDDLSQKLEAAPGQEEFWLRKMQAMPSTGIKDRDIVSILKLLAYEDAQRPAAPSPQSATTADAPAAHPASAGRQFFVEHSCNACHTVGAEKGTGGPPLDAVGSKLSRDQMLSRMKVVRAGTDKFMPPLPTETTDEQLGTLVDYLQTLK